jgi:two-component system nitrogen regulation response regulator GlnG
MSPKRVLIVDDEEASLESLAMLVADAGFTVETRSRFEEAKQALREAPPDVLITDVRLGAYNGLQLAIQMRDLRPESPIVVLSAFDDTMLREQAARCSARYLIKPVSGSELLERNSTPARAPSR